MLFLVVTHFTSMALRIAQRRERHVSDVLDEHKLGPIYFVCCGCLSNMHAAR
jgi:hypothetical protein